MPLLRTYDAARREVGTSLHSAYLDRLSRWSDIREYLSLLYDFARSYPQVRVLELASGRATAPSRSSPGGGIRRPRLVVRHR